MELTVEDFDDLKSKYKNQERIFIRNKDGRIIREMELMFLDHHFDWDKKSVHRSPYNKCRWNGEDKIWEWEKDILTEGGFTYMHGDTMCIYSKTLRIRSTPYNYKIKIEDNQITVGTSGFKNPPSPIINLYDMDIIEKSIQKCIDNVHNMDISPKIKQIIKNTIVNAKYVFDEEYSGYKRFDPRLEWKY